MGQLFDRYGPWALITGASSGIGEAFARELAAEGFSLVLVARRKDRLDAVAADLLAIDGCEVEVVVADLAQPDFMNDIESSCAGRDIGLLISNAGDGAKGPFVDTPLVKKLSILDVNCKAPVLLASAFIPRFEERGRGGLVITSSMEASLGFPFSATYAASKAFATSLGEGLWGELEPKGIDVLVLEPGGTDTEILPMQGIDPRTMTGLMQPKEVALEALKNLGRRPVVVAGALNRLLVRLLSWLPRKLAIRMAGQGIKGAIEASKGQV